MGDRELGLILTNLEVEVAGERITLFEGSEIAFAAKENLGDAIESALEGVEHIDRLHAEYEIWEEGELVETDSFEAEDFDIDDLWGAYYEALREAYKEEG